MDAQVVLNVTVSETQIGSNVRSQRELGFTPEGAIVVVDEREGEGL